MNITLLTIEKINKPFIKKGIQEYNKRLSRYCKIKHITLKKIEDIHKNIKNNSYIILVNPKGEMMSSERLGSNIKKMGVQGKSDIVFLITDKEVLDGKEDMHLALTSMEMDSELMLLTLYEQIYRAFTLINNLPYHK